MMKRLLTLALCLLPMSAVAQEDDKSYLAGLLEGYLSDAGRAVTITGFEGALSSRATLQEMTIADDAGVWLTLRDVVSASWIVPPAGSVLRHRFDLMFQQDGLAPPLHTVETSALLFITRMLQQSDMIAVVAEDVARYYAAHGIVTVLPLAMPCHMDAFGIITRSDRLLSPAAKVMMKALKQTSLVQYGRRLEVGD